MSGKPVARLGDAGSHGGVIITGAATVFVNGKPLARVSDLYGCAIPNHPPNPIISGSNSVKGEGQAFAHVGSKTACGATIIEGSPNVFVGDNVFFGDGVVFGALPQPEYDEQVQIIDENTSEPIPFYPFYIEVSDGQVVYGETDSEGYTPRIKTAYVEKLHIWVGDEAETKIRGNNGNTNI